MEGQQMLLEFPHLCIQMQIILVLLVHLYLIQLYSSSIDKDFILQNAHEEEIQTVTLSDEMYFM